jgi:hypothetical protein
MNFLVMALCALAGYVVLWAIYLPVAYFFNRDAEHDPEDEAVPPWLAELEATEEAPQSTCQVARIEQPPVRKMDTSHITASHP